MKNSYHNLGRASAQMKFTKSSISHGLEKIYKIFSLLRLRAAPHKDGSTVYPQPGILIENPFGFVSLNDNIEYSKTVEWKDHP